jgi:hypothetical protein
MKFTQVEVEVQRTIGFTAVFPAATTLQQIQNTIRWSTDMSDLIDTFDTPDWDVNIIQTNAVDIPYEECTMVLDPKTKRHVPGPALFRVPDVVLVSSEGRFCNAADADWWKLTPEQMLEEKEKERRLQDILHPDQLPLF